MHGSRHQTSREDRYKMPRQRRFRMYDGLEMAANSLVRVARGLTLHGAELRSGNLNRAALLRAIGVPDTTFRAAGEELGAKKTRGLGFFDSESGLEFGPGAGLVLGISLGAESLRGALVDANGSLFCDFQASHFPGQLELAPADLLDRVKLAFHSVIEKAFAEKRSELLIDGKIPLLGVSVAWPVPLSREKLPYGHALAAGGWRSGARLDQRVARHLKIPDTRSHAVNAAFAAAVGVAHMQTNRPEHSSQKVPRLAMVLRLAGDVSASTIIVEQPEDHAINGPISGFVSSVVVGGIDHFAGQIGQAPIDENTVEHLNKNLLEGLGRLEPYWCSCTPHQLGSTESVPRHLEAFVGALATSRRVDPTGPERTILRRIVDHPDEPVHLRALSDVGTLVGRALCGPVALLNPATITLTGSLAADAVRAQIDSVLTEAHVWGTQPEFPALSDEDNRFIRVKGAALVVIRRHVLRRLDELLSGGRSAVATRLRELTLPLSPGDFNP